MSLKGGFISFSIKLASLSLSFSSEETYTAGLNARRVQDLIKNWFRLNSVHLPDSMKRCNYTQFRQAVCVGWNIL